MNIRNLYLASLKSALQGDLSGSAHFYTEAEKYKEELGLDFSESAVEEFPFIEEVLTTLLSSYDFTRCVRPDGSAYGTGGKCKKGKEEILRELNEGPLKMNPLSGLLKSFKDNRKAHLPSAPTDSLVVLGNKLSGSQSKTEDKSLLEKVVKELSKRSDYPTWRWEWWMFD